MTASGLDGSARDEVYRKLLDSGALAPEWVPAFEAVPRSAFLPELMWPFDMDTGTSFSVSRSGDLDLWHAYADADVPVVTQWDDGAHTGADPGRLSTSSASMPSVVARMLRDLDVQPGARVLEIGTGTGWNAALLSYRLGAANVVTVEVDEAVADAARARLSAVGLHPGVVTGDGLLGYPDGAPYDRIIVTAGVRDLPYAWIRQTRPGGLIVAPWGTHYSNVDCVVRLVVAEDGRSASGRLTGAVEFMKVRSQRHRVDQTAYLPDGFPGDAVTTVTELTAADLGLDDRLRHPFAAVAGLLVSECTLLTDRRGTAVSAWLYGLTDRSWAAAVLVDGQVGSTVYQSGPRRLWDELTRAHQWWVAAGEPDVTRFGLTVTAGRTNAWFDNPRSPLLLQDVENAG
ncbi:MULTISPECIES: methyltransferase domain-containing protein [Streptomyces]|uniref:methyltransferase domain-containing protein n=1 Tax=Streptomyces TaxID=1883 RepID=UPI00025CE7CD|nr:methyltransferase domain-containing protein [Streptomyces tsukubensis]AZK94268.1 protein-L-isoaspartate(D-aspartate) O-methyltransferase [Streptomyces tsukubensis]EIF89968.1 protein-L-isoaspartate(D-aspartate) O-methyltransferase [Streptomyces tsukubensis NRRL18488]